MYIFVVEFAMQQYMCEFTFSGVTYIKYGKTSEAALAMEEMNGKSLDGDPKPLKVKTF